MLCDDSGQAFPSISWTGQLDANIARVSAWGLVTDPRAGRAWEHITGQVFNRRALKINKDPSYRRRRPAWSRVCLAGIPRYTHAATKHHANDAGKGGVSRIIVGT